MILLNVSFSQLKLNIKDDIAKSFLWYDVSQTEDVERGNDTGLTVRMKGEKLTDKETSLSTGHDSCKDTSSLLWASAPSQETKDGGARSCTDT